MSPFAILHVHPDDGVRVVDSESMFTVRVYSEHQIERYRRALQEIATGRISGESRNYKDTLAIVRRVALEALRDA